ncbi:MAG: lactate dehydrogenase [Acidobacteria bacterium]|nr:lactate dehydrogenase [Acidobacteriota bacterium]
MSKLNEKQLVTDLDALAQNAVPTPAFLAVFPFRLLRAYGMNETRVRRLEQGYKGVDLVGGVADLIVPKLIHYRAATAGNDVDDVIADLKTEQNPKKTPGKNAPRFLIVTDGVALRIEDMKTEESLKGESLADLEIEYDLLLPLAGRERYVAPAEREADVKAARHMREIVDAVRAHDPVWNNDTHQEALNTFATRILFCLYADDSGIFDPEWSPTSGKKPDQPFASMIAGEATCKDGSEMKAALQKAFRILNMPLDDPQRANFAPRFQKLRYVNGDLFAADLQIPDFDGRARRALMKAIDLDWKDINADIFGSMIQAVAGDAERSEFGMHYTSVKNIMKVLGPLFLDRLESDLEDAQRRGDRKALEALIDRLANIHVFDPACGSGNFLIIAYREIRRIEREALAALGRGQLDMTRQSKIKLDHFHGIEPNDFACRTARLSLWISQIQADRLMSEIGLTPAPILPLHDAGDIYQGSALEIDWDLVVSPANTNNGETYIVGNPPYLGSTYQSAEQKADMDRIFDGHLRTWRNLDFVSAWFKLMVDHIRDHGSRGALVTTNSLCQGESVPTLWPWIAEQGVEIFSSHTSFKWRNSAAKNAGVSCAIIAIRRNDDPTKERGDKRLHVVNGKGRQADIESRKTDNINAYLIDGPNAIVEKASKPMNGLPEMMQGNKPTDGGHLFMTRQERDNLLETHPAAEKFIKPVVGSRELLHSLERYCLWIDDNDLNEAMKMESIARRVDAVRKTRMASPDRQANEMADTAHQFREHLLWEWTLVVPVVSSEDRPYLQISILPSTVVTNLAFMLPNPAPWALSLMATRMMHQWCNVVGSKLKTDTRFSNTLVYNTFPVPNLTDDRKKVLDSCARSVLKARQPYLDEGKTLAWLYSKDMPAELKSAHEALDLEYETMCIGRAFHDDAERLAWLFREYEKMKKRHDAKNKKR